MVSAPEFTLFGVAHITTLVIIAGVCYSLWRFNRTLIRQGWLRSLESILAGFIVIELLTKVVVYRAYGMPWERLLPLQI